MLVYCFAALSVSAFAQKRFVVVDVETRVPIRGVNVQSGIHRADTTDWQGFITIPDSCRTLSLTHVKYESRILNGTLLKGGEYTSFHDHRMAMALTVASLGADGPIIIDDTDCVAKSFPAFFDIWRQGFPSA